ncbi:MAG: Do family serine endopeptidase [Proteobacteria bacterium]|nr:Do family serine endopeptidase [Pseudomonadota bacterium]
MISKTKYLLPSLLALVAAACSPGQGKAQDAGLAPPNRHAPAGAAEMRLSFAPVVKKAAPAVVNVYARRVVRQQIDPFWQLFGGVPRGMTQERVLQSLGSGVIVRADGLIVTNNHVVEGGQEFMVVLSDRREFPAKVLLADPHTDLAVLKIEVGSERLPVLPIEDSGDTQVGDLVLAIGNPFGVGQTVTNGIVSALNRTDGPSGAGGSYIQTDAPINPGNSGGALVDMDGNLIGINSMIISNSGGSNGVGLAIPGAMVRRVVETAVGGGHTLVRAWLGAKTDPITGEIAKSIGLTTPQGALVTNLYPGGPAAKAGLKTGDVVTAVNGAAVNDPANLNFQIATLAPGQIAKVAYLRDGKPMTANVRVEPPSGGEAVERTLAGETPLTGTTVSDFTPAAADKLGLDPYGANGVVLTKVPAQSFAAGRLGLQPGDLIRGVNGREVSSVGDLQAALAQAQAARRGWSLTIQRGSQVTTVQLGR